MSLVYGVIDFKGNQNISDTLSSIQNSCLPAHYEYHNQFVVDNVGLGLIHRFNTPESVNEKLPLTQENYTIVSTARIDNRDELFTLLSITKALQSEITDSQLILKAYQKWKKACINYLEGDWAFAIWDNSEKELFVALDQYGNTGLYYYHSNNFFAFSSSVKGLLGIKEIPHILNEQFVLAKLNSAQPEIGSTGYRHVHYLQSAHTISIKNNRVDKQRYWKMEDVKMLRFSTPDDYIQGFLERYTIAVKGRLRSYGPVGSTLSGGLDSGSVSVLAATELRKQDKKLKTYTSVPLYETQNLVGLKRFGDETDFANETASYSGNMEMNYIKGLDLPILESVFQTVNIHDAPSHASGNAFWILELLETAKEQGVTTLLTGQSGNATVSWAGIPNPNILSIINLYKNGLITPFQVVKKIIKLGVPESLIANQTRPTKIEQLLNFSAIDLNFAKRMQQEGMKFFDIVPDFTSSKNPIEQRLKILKPERNTGGLLWQENAYAYGLNIWDPTKDKRLIEFCLGIPDHLFRNEKYDRLIIRKAMQNILPPKVQWNTKRGRQAADISYRVQKEYAEIAQLLNEFEQSEFISSYLDVQRMKMVLENTKKEANAKTNNACATILLRGIGAGIFLKRFE